ETLANITTGLSYKVVDGIAIALFIQAFYLWVYDRGLQWNPELSVWSVLALVVFIDFCFYLNHVLMHKVRWFWNVHVTHHSSEHMNFSTALRQNFTFALSGSWLLWWIPSALLGFDKNWVLIAIEANLVYQFFLHTEQVRTLGWLERFLIHRHTIACTTGATRNRLIPISAVFLFSGINYSVRSGRKPMPERFNTA